MSHKIILDTDPGIDDAMAIFTAMAHPDIELLGLTTVFGNVSAELAVQNGLRLVEMTGVDVPVCKGCTVPRNGRVLSYPDFVHGADGFGNVNLSAPNIAPNKLDSADFIIETVKKYPHEVTLVAVGPLANLALAIERAPEILSLVKEVVLMGGCAFTDGNVSPVAEANIFSDPDAADLVMAADWPVVMVGLDVTHEVSFSRAMFAEIAEKNPKVGSFMQQAANFYISFYMSVRDKEMKKHADKEDDSALPHDQESCFGHDICAVLYVVDPTVFTTIEGSICVATEGVAAGQTIVDHRQLKAYLVPNWNDRPLQKTCTQVDATRIREMFLSSMTSQFWS